MFGLSQSAGAGADFLQEAIKQKLLEQVQRHQMQMAEQQRELQARGLDVTEQAQRGVQERWSTERADAQTAAAKEEAEKAAALAERKMIRGRLTATNPALGGLFDARDAGLPVTDQHALESPEAHAPHLQAARAAELGEFEQKEQIKRKYAPPRQEGMPGWSFKDYTDPSTNQTQTLRMNARTGAVEPVAIPSGLQPGGARQTRLSAAQQEDLATMKTVEDMSHQVEQIGTATGWKGVGGLASGSISQQLMRQLGRGDPREEELRNFVGNIQGTIAKLRGGTAFTAQEKAMLDNYTPTINEDPKSIQAKLKSLRSFIGSKRQNLLQFAGAMPGGAQTPDGGNPDPLGLFKQ